MSSNQVPPWLEDTMEDDAYIPMKTDIRRVQPQSINEMLLKYLCLNGLTPPVYDNFLTSDGNKFLTSDGLDFKVIS